VNQAIVGHFLPRFFRAGAEIPRFLAGFRKPSLKLAIVMGLA
jgi:hypothetical protein